MRNLQIQIICACAIPVEITDGKPLITFTSNLENPEINGIEIIPQI